MSKEYIEKEAAINYLTLNMCWYDEEGSQVDDWDERKAIISDLLDGIPPADVAPVVRCKNCKYHTAYRCPNDNKLWTHSCAFGNLTDGDEFYCALGARREVANDEPISSRSS